MKEVYTWQEKKNLNVNKKEKKNPERHKEKSLVPDRRGRPLSRKKAKPLSTFRYRTVS